jgi:hypothetical protein
MLFPVVGAVTAMWLLASPLVGLETGFRAALAIGVGLAALVLAPLGIWSGWARRSVAVLGMALALVSFADPPSIGALASFAACATALVVAGAAPSPVIERVRDGGVAARATAAAPVESGPPRSVTAPAKLAA